MKTTLDEKTKIVRVHATKSDYRKRTHYVLYGEAIKRAARKLDFPQKYIISLGRYLPSTDAECDTDGAVWHFATKRTYVKWFRAKHEADLCS